VTLHEFGGEFTAIVGMREPTKDFFLVRYVDRVRAAISGVADVEPLVPYFRYFKSIDGDGG